MSYCWKSRDLVVERGGCGLGEGGVLAFIQVMERI